MSALAEALPVRRAHEPGIVLGLPIEQYHADPALSNSGLRDFQRSPLHYYALHLDPARPPEEPKAGQLAGAMAHCAILEPAQFPRRYVIGPEGRRNTKAWDAFEATLAAGQTGVKADEYHAAFAQAHSVRRHPEVAKLLASGRSEVSAFWRDDATGVMCRCRPDWVHSTPHGVILVDCKTVGDASATEFARQIARKNYHCQDPWYWDGYEQASGIEVLGFVFVGVETAYPYACSVVMIDSAARDKGRQINRELLDRFAECQRTDRWPGYSDGVEVVELPRWAA